MTKAEIAKIRDEEEFAPYVKDLADTQIELLISSIGFIDRVFNLGAQLENHHEYTGIMMLMKGAVDNEYAKEISEWYGLEL